MQLRPLLDSLYSSEGCHFPSRIPCPNAGHHMLLGTMDPSLGWYAHHPLGASFSTGCLTLSVVMFPLPRVPCFLDLFWPLREAYCLGNHVHIRGILRTFEHPLLLCGVPSSVGRHTPARGVSVVLRESPYVLGCFHVPVMTNFPVAGYLLFWAP